MVVETVNFQSKIDLDGGLILTDDFLHLSKSAKIEQEDMDRCIINLNKTLEKSLKEHNSEFKLKGTNLPILDIRKQDKKIIDHQKLNKFLNSEKRWNTILKIYGSYMTGVVTPTRAEIPVTITLSDVIENEIELEVR